MPTLPPPERHILPALRVIAAASLGACLWMTWGKWTAGAAQTAGCGSAGGCAEALTGRWSEWFSIPVTCLAALLWTGVLLLTLPTVRRALGRAADQLLAGAATLLIISAIWFCFLMAWEIKAFCPWCAALHASGLVAGGLILLSSRQAAREDCGLFAAATQAGAASAALLILGQLFGTAPETHLLTGAEQTASPGGGDVSAPPPETASHTEITYLSGALKLRRDQVPMLGSAEAPHVLVEVFDYTCSACRAQYRDLENLKARFPDEFAVAAMPAPLDPACNPHIRQAPSEKERKDSCALARLALAVWVEKPEVFPAFHDFLMTGGAATGIESALAEARRLLPGRNPEETSSGADVARLLAENLRIHGILTRESSTMPKLILRGDRVLHGLPSGSRRFQEIIAAEFSPSLSQTLSVPVTTRGR